MTCFDYGNYMLLEKPLYRLKKLKLAECNITSIDISCNRKIGGELDLSDNNLATLKANTLNELKSL